ncbi:MAG TPA: MBL fold metallo-hydrolase RNA specificity domain-containing protein [Methanomassiliicoccales archaeon]|nr:MBL fold metallo-hydrolase RNA specificity domain-containing protein [Methanomassiliicoccales archaeon]
MSAKVTVFDGADCIGGNKIHLEFDGHGVLLDFGTNYKTMGLYYEEFLKPRQGRGLHDFVRMGLVPLLSCYRSEIIPSDLDMSLCRRVQVDALMISHAHMDHMGHAGLLEWSIPFVASPITAAVMKALRDLGAKGIEGECVYGQPRKRDDHETRLIRSPKLKNGEPLTGRDYVLTTKPSGEMCGFWEQSILKTREIDAGSLLEPCDLGFSFQAFPVDHSVYGATAYAIDTESGWVVYTGDLRAHGAQGKSTWEFAKKAAELEPKALLIEGTRTSRNEPGQECSEETVRNTCLEVVEAEKGMVIADFSPRNFERLETFAHIAEKTNRTLVITKKDAFGLQAIQSADGVDRKRSVAVFDALKLTESGAEEAACATLGNELVDPLDIGENPGGYILSFSMYDLGNLLDIGVKGGTYVYSSSEPYSEEQVIDFRRLSNWLELFGLKVRGFTMQGDASFEPEVEEGFHASGHASTADLLSIVEQISPEIVIPVHTEDPGPFKRLKGIEVAIPQKGIPISL